MLIFGDFTSLSTKNGMVIEGGIEHHLIKDFGFTQETLDKLEICIAFSNGAYKYLLFADDAGEFHELICEDDYVEGMGYTCYGQANKLKKVSYEYLMSDKFTVFPFKGKREPGVLKYQDDIPYYQSEQLIKASLYNIKTYIKLMRELAGVKTALSLTNESLSKTLNRCWFNLEQGL